MQLRAAKRRNKIRRLLILVLFPLLCLCAWAGPKPATKEYASSCARVWNAAKAVVQNHYDVLNLNDQSQSGSFTTGNFWSGVRPIAFSLSGAGESCTVSVTGHYSGLTHNDKGDFFKRIAERLNAGLSSLSYAAKKPVISEENLSEPRTVEKVLISAQQPMVTSDGSKDRQLAHNVSSEPRVFMESASHGNQWNARRDQSMELSKDFEKDCPEARITIRRENADYIVVLNRSSSPHFE